MGALADILDQEVDRMKVEDEGAARFLKPLYMPTLDFYYEKEKYSFVLFKPLLSWIFLLLTAKANPNYTQ